MRDAEREAKRRSKDAGACRVIDADELVYDVARIANANITSASWIETIADGLCAIVDALGTCD
jgi:hypothetical protein